MEEIDPKTERLLEEAVVEIQSKNYGTGRLAQGLFVVANDLRRFDSTGGNRQFLELEKAIDQTIDRQQMWVRNELQTAELPHGFAEAAANGRIELIDFDAPEIDHEWVMYPGKDLFEECIRGFHDILCADYGVHGVSERIHDGANVPRDIALLLFGQLGGGPISWIPFVAVLSTYIADYGLDRICSDYDPNE